MWICVFHKPFKFSVGVHNSPYAVAADANVQTLETDSESAAYLSRSTHRPPTCRYPVYFLDFAFWD
jgi:hypothetical protein